MCRTISLKIIFILILLNISHLLSQVENVTIVHPVYQFLMHAEAKGLLPHFSSTELPLQRNQIVDALKTIRSKLSELNENEIKILARYEIEFEIEKRNNSVVFYSPTDSTEVLFRNLLSDDEKFVYHYKDSLHSVSLSPLASVECSFGKVDDTTKKVLFGNEGFRLFGTLGGRLGYNLQVTNGAVFTGDRTILLEDRKFRQNVKFGLLKDDFDFTESHVRYQYDWFYAMAGRESRLLGSGINQRLFISTNASPMDALSFGVRFKGFEYRFTHFGMVGMTDTSGSLTGVATRIPPKYMAWHRFAIKPEWGEIAFSEGVIYSNRPVELAYFTPLSFLFSLQNALHDRDNSTMCGDITVRPFKGIQIKGSYLLDDLIFSKIGTGYWSNKSAWNIGMTAALPLGIDAGVEYIRVEPFTFSHYGTENAMVNDGMLYGTELFPNSDEWSFLLQYFWNSRYPLTIRGGYQRHGANIYDNKGALIKNVGGDPFQTIRPVDSGKVTFLDGDLQEIFFLQLQTGYELVRGFSLKGIFQFKNQEGRVVSTFRLTFSFEDF
jgi:hypothetical protein